MDDLDLIALELAINECAEDDYTEMTIEDFSSKILADLQNLVSFMLQYIKNIKSDIAVLMSKTSMKAKLRILKAEAKSGKNVNLPDFKNIEKVYTKACDTLPKELKKLLKVAYPINSTSDLEKFKDKKERFEKQLNEVERSFDEIVKNTRVYKPDEACRIIDGLLHENSIYIDTYYKAAREFDHFKNDYKRALDDCARKNDGLGKSSLSMHKSLVAKASTSLSRMLKKATFVVTALVI